ncbi:MAG TPA: cyanophycin synthetase [Longimicrobium sp.]|nr:cyanophycin synthetase [Longimicrobium sp.]
MTEAAAGADSTPELHVRSVRALRGASLWGTRPVAACEVELDPPLAEQAPAALPGFLDRLAAALPGLSSAADGGGNDAPAAWADLVGRVAVALHAAACSVTTFHRVIPGRHGDAPQVAVGYAEEELGIESLHEAAVLIRRLLRGEDGGVAEIVARLGDVFQQARPGPTTLVLIEEAERRGIPVRRFPGDEVVQLGLGRNLRRIDGTMTDFTSVIATDITSDKDRTKRILARHGLPVPGGGVAKTEDEAVRIAERLGYPVFVKPLDANDGRGSSGRLESEAQVRAAFSVAVAEHPCVVVERFVAGRDHRVVVVAGRVVAVAERVPAHVVGDGRRTIRELAEEINRDPSRDLSGPRPTHVPLPLDEITREFLGRGGRSLETVPAAGETVHLRATANISTGGTSVDRTDQIHPRNAALCVLATGAVGLDIAGLDVLTDDISVPFDENGASIIEVNASPGIRMHTDPDVGTPRDVPGAVLDWIYPPGSPATIPVIAITGTNGKTTTTRLIAHLFRGTGGCVGYATTDGIYHQHDLLMEGDFTGPFAAGVVLSHPQVDVAVIETARGGILRGGLGYPACDVGVVLNVSADHLGLRGIHTVEDLAEVKAVIVTAVKPDGYAVLNADDPLVLAMRERTPGTVVLTSAVGEDSPAVAGHLARGGTCVVVENEGGSEWIVIRGGRREGERVPVAPVAELPLMIGGAARFQLGNLLAATAAAHVQGMPADQVAEGLRSFVPSGQATPGRINVLPIRGGTVILDYAHNPAAVQGLMDFVGRMEARRRIGVVTMPGDRRDQDLREMGRIVSVLDHVVVKEHPQYRRGRPEGEVVRLIGEGLDAGGLGADRREAVFDETAAVERALEIMEPGDLVVILGDDVIDVLAQLQPLVDGNGAAPARQSS